MKSILIRLAAYGTVAGTSGMACYNHAILNEPGRDTDVWGYVWQVLLPALVAAIAAALESWKNTGATSAEAAIAADISTLANLLKSKGRSGDTDGLVKAVELVKHEFTRPLQGASTEKQA